MIDELSRHRLFTKLQDVLGVDDAAVLIEHLPPVGWADVATKRDLEPLVARLEVLGNDLGTLRAEVSSQFRTTLFTMMGMMLTLTGLVFAAAKLA